MHKPRQRSQRRAGIRAFLLLSAFVLLLAVLVRLDWSKYISAGESGSLGQSAVLRPGEEPRVLMQVYYFDVGQGDCELVQVPAADGMFNMLIDTGESAYGAGLLKTLEDLGVEKLDVLVMSHPHADHMGAMGELICNMEVDRLYMPVLPEEYTPTTTAYERVLDAVAEKGVPVTRLITGTPMEVPGTVSVQVLAPDADADWEDTNNYSAVLRITAGETAFLFTGDAGKESEAVILEKGGELYAQVLKVGHHGSGSAASAAFFDAVAPDTAVISCGKDNDDGHPHRETLELLARRGTAVLRTDEDGTILAVTDGKSITVQKGLASIQSTEP